MRMSNRTSKLCLGLASVAALALIPACSGGTPGNPNNRGPFEVLEISTGSNPIFPYRVREVDSFGQPTNRILEITSIEELKANASGNNLVLPIGIFPTGAPILPDGNPGNQFLKIRFSHELDPASILSTAPGSVVNSFLTTAISLLQYNSNTEVTTTLPGRAFVGGYTVINDGSGGLDIAQVAEPDGSGGVTMLTTYVDGSGNTRAIPADIIAGFPRGFTNAGDLVSPKSFVFVADTNDDGLSNFDSFPAAVADNTLMRIVVTSAVEDTDGKILQTEVCTATTVGVDNRPPNVLGFVNGDLQITPGNGATGVNPTEPILVRFNKPVQPTDVGTFFDRSNLVPSGGGATLNVTIAANTFSVIYYADPLSSGDFCNYRIVPAYNLPGSSDIDISVNDTVVRDLQTVFLGQTVNTTFSTGQGPGIVNAPVAPDALYVGMVGSRPGLKVIDLNGFGQTTGGYLVDPSGNEDPVFDWRNTTRFQFNPNIGSPGITPNLAAPTDATASGLDAGSPGVFKLIQDSSGETLLVGAPILGAVADIHIGCPLDMVFNNENINVNTNRANHLEPISGVQGSGNGFSTVPHPNPPRLRFPPPNPASAIFGEEPTANPAAPNGTGCVPQHPINILVKGNPNGSTKASRGIFGHVTDAFNGPAPRPGSPPPPTPLCPFWQRQQIGHFLYVLDSDNKQILVLNSNRMTVLDTIKLADPVNMAMSPNLRRLAVTNFASGSVSFIDIDPSSDSFHQVVSETRVRTGPGAIVWQPDGEDLVVLHPTESALSIINGADLQLKKEVTGFLTEPVGLVCTDRQNGFGNATGLYFAYVLNRNGTVAVYESGPDGVNGIGFNDIIGTIPDKVFRSPKSISIDLQSNMGGVFISHVDDLGNGQVSRLEMTSSPGLQPLSPNNGGFLLPPTYRQKEWGVTQTYGGYSATNPTRDALSGRAPREVCADEIFNIAGAPGQITGFNNFVPLPPPGHSDKSLAKVPAGGAATSPVTSKFLFIAIADKGVVDVFDIGTAEMVTTIDVGGTPSVLGSYWRQ